MRFCLNRLGKIVSASDTEGGKNLAVFTGFNFLTVVDKTSRENASRFISRITAESNVQSSFLRLDLGEGPAEYVCFGHYSQENNTISIVLRDAAPVSAAPVSDLLDKLKLIKARMRMLFNQMPTALLLVSRDGAIEGVNPALEKMFGFTGEELVQKSIASLISSSSMKTATNQGPILSELIDGRFYRMSGQLKSGEIIPVELCLKQLDEDGEQFVLCVFDISERVALEKMKQEFVGMVSHDLRAPLSFMISTLALFNEGIVDPASDPGKKKLQDIEDEAFRLSQLVTDLLDLTRVESGRFEVRKSSVALSSLIELGLRTLIGPANEKEISLTTPDDDMELYIDLERMAQVVTNLVSNAIKACDVGGSIDISCTKKDGVVELKIRDNGVGLDREQQIRIFESFVTMKHANTKSESHSGTGLGLSICKSIVELHDGTITIDSAPGQGTTFSIRVPTEAK